MMDRLQRISSTGWYDSPYGTLYPDSCHTGPGGVPIGGNFLFEDGHVEWRKFMENNILLAPLTKPRLDGINRDLHGLLPT